MTFVACATADQDPDEDDDFEFEDGKGDDALPADWTGVGRGVIHRQVNAGPAIVIAYGGYTARLAHSAAWASELVDARLGAAGVGHIYAVSGPADPGYNAREIGNSKLRAHLATIDDATSPIIVVAHSSGSYVAHELFAQLHGISNTSVLARINYADLDGGGSGLTEAIVGELGNAVFVYARDPTLASGLSRNHSTARALADAYADQGATLFETVVPSTGCFSGAGWCLHDAVITQRPHNRSTFDVARDYTDFVDRPVTTEYLEPLVRLPD